MPVKALTDGDFCEEDPRHKMPRVLSNGELVWSDEESGSGEDDEDSEDMLTSERSTETNKGKNMGSQENNGKATNALL